MKIKKPFSTIAFEVFSYTILTVMAVICVLPFLFVISGSLSSHASVAAHGYRLIPSEWSLEGYQTIFSNSQGILRAYWVTTVVTVIGTSLGLIITTLAGYVLSRKEFRYRKTVSFLIYFTSIFGGGLVPWYYMYAGVLGIKGTLTALWLPGLTSPFYIILMRTFASDSLPDAVTEAAMIDGAGHFTIFWRIALPLMKPALATVGLFLALGYWNDWYNSSLFSINSNTWELQFYLYNMVNKADAAKELAARSNISILSLPTESMKMAMAIVVTGPILLLYPFVQKYFVTGITVGSVKG